MPSFLRYGAYPYIVVVREGPAGGSAATGGGNPAGRSAATRWTRVEHRFVGLFTAAARNANVLEIPLVAGRVQEALALSESDPAHPGQLLLEVFQTIPRSELFALEPVQLLEMAQEVIELGSRRRKVALHARGSTGHFVECVWSTCRGIATPGAAVAG